MGRISQWAVRQPWWALITWIALMAAIIVLSIQFGGEYNDDFELPDTESTTAQDLLSELSGSAGTGAGLEGQIVWSPDDQSIAITDDAVQQPMTALMTEVSKSPGVLCVVSPYGDPLGTDCPEQPAAEGEGDQPPPEEQPAEEPSEAAQGAMAHFGPAGVSPDGARGLRDGDLRRCDLRRPRQRRHPHRARADRGAER